MRILGQIVSFLLAAVAVPLFVLASCNYAIEQTLLSPDTYRAALDDEQIFEDILPVALTIIVEESQRPTNRPSGAPPPPDSDDLPVQVRDVIEAIDTEALREVTNILVPPDWLQARSEQIFEIGTGLLAGEAAILDEPVSFDEIKNRWSGTQAEEAASLIVASAPECTRTQADELRRYLEDGEGQFPICNPAASNLSNQIEGAIVSWLGAVATELPEGETTVEELFQLERDNVRTVALFVELDRQSLLITLLCPLALLSLIITIAIRSLSDFGRWIGGVAVASGIFIALLLILLQAATSGIVGALVSAETEIEQFFAGLLTELLLGAVREANSIFLVHSAIFLGMGFALLALVWVMRRDNEGDDLVYITEDGQIMTEDGQIISTATQRRNN